MSNTTLSRNLDLHIGKQIRRRRRLLGLTQAQLGQLVSVAFQQIQKYECGANRVTAARLWELARALNVEVGYFYQGCDDTQTCVPAQDSPLVEIMQNPELIELVSMYAQLRGTQRRAVFDITRTMAKKSTRVKNNEVLVTN